MELVWLSQEPQPWGNSSRSSFFSRHHHHSLTMDFDDYCGPEWEPWRFDMTFDDFWPLMDEFNTVPSAIQTYGDFCDDFEGIAHNAENADDFRKALDAHRKAQLRFYKNSLKDISQEVGLSHSHISSGLWNALLDLVSQNPLIKPVDELGWQSRVLLQGLIEALQHFHRRLVPTAPLAIKPPTPAPSPSAGSPSASSDSSNQNVSQPTRIPRPRKQKQKENAVAQGRVQKRDNSKRKEASPRKTCTRSSACEEPPL